MDMSNNASTTAGYDTPMQVNTPAPMGNYTPTPRTTFDDYAGASFTPGPQMTAISPTYTPSRVESPTTNLGSGGYVVSPGYIHNTSPMSSGQSPYYGSGLHYNPTSPHYSTSNSPSMSSGAGSSRIYSPNSPSYSLNSPRYSPSYSPRSPNYTSAHSSNNTPSSSQNVNTQTYTPNSPAYRGGFYNPVSPAYEKMLQPVREDEGEESQEEEDEEEKTNK